MTEPLKIRLADWPLPTDVWLKREHYPVLAPLLSILSTLDEGDWTAHDHTTERVFPLPGTPMCEHRSRWTLRRNGEPAGELRGDVQESGLNMAWPSFDVILVEARLSDGRTVTAATERSALWLTSAGFPLEALAEAATAAGLKVRTFPS